MSAQAAVEYITCPYTLSFSATEMVISYTTDGKTKQNVYELHRERPEGVFRTIMFVRAKNGRKFEYGMIPAERREDFRWVAWPA